MDIKKAIQQYYVSALKRYADFKGRTSKKAYWMFVLFNIIFAWASILIDNILGTHESGFWGMTNGTFNNMYSLLLLVPGLAIGVRRLHDVGEEWTKLLYVFIPIVGWIILIMLLIKDGDPAENKFGPVPVDGDIPEPGGHPYTPNEEKPEEKFFVPDIRKEAEEKIKEEKKAPKEKPKKEKIEKKDRTVKWGRDKGAIDFRPPKDRK